MKTRIIAIFAAFLALAVNSQAKDPKPSGPPTGKYACVFSFGGRFFDTQPIFLRDGNRYESSKGEGTWKYDAATSRIRFQTGVLARSYPAGRYVASGPVRGGLKKQQGPAFVLQPSAAYKKQQGPEAVPQYCYFVPAK